MDRIDKPPLQLPRKPRRGEALELEIERLDADGHGEAWLELELGPQRARRRYRVRVPRALPGDRVRGLVEGTKRGVISARVDALLCPASARVEPRCPHFGRREQAGKGCGGCSLQSLPYAEQLLAKRQLVATSFAQAGVDVAVPAVIGMPDPWHYRNKMEFSFGHDRGGELALGLHPFGYRYEVLDLQRCFLLSEFVAPFVAAVRDWVAQRGLVPYAHRRDEGFLRTLTIREGKRTGQRLVELTTAADGSPSAEAGASAARVAEDFCRFVLDHASTRDAALTSVYWTEHRVRRGERTRFIHHHLAGRATLAEALQLPGGRRLEFEIHPRAFFQPNTLQAERLYAQVLRAAGLSEGQPPLRALDLYCGTGTIGLCLACYGHDVVGVELSAEAVDNARANAAANGIDSVRFIAGDAGKVLGAELAGWVDRIGLVVVDPPRSGLAPAACEHLGTIAAPRLVYVSCNHQALARDVQVLRKRGYQLRSVQPVDMFPQTAHVETVALLTRTA